MKEVVFKALDRKVIGKQVRALRREGRLPAVLYGVHIGSLPISLDYHEASLVLPTISSSHLIKVSVEGGEQHTVLVRETAPSGYRIADPRGFPGSFFDGKAAGDGKD